MLDRLFYELGRGDGMTWVFAILMAALFALLLWLIVCGIYYLFDTVGVEVKDGKAVILAKTTLAPYTTYILVGKVLIPQFHPRSYYLHVDILDVDEREAMGSFDKELWDAATVGKTVPVQYKMGRLSDEAYLEAVTL